MIPRDPTPPRLADVTSVLVTTDDGKLAIPMEPGRMVLLQPGVRIERPRPRPAYSSHGDPLRRFVVRSGFDRLLDEASAIARDPDLARAIKNAR